MKQVIVIRTDLNMSPGKMIAQGSHASLNAYLNAPMLSQLQWMNTGHKKIVCRVSSQTKLENVFAKAVEAGLPVAMVEDWGLTEVAPNTKTAIAIGPAPEAQINLITKRLSVL